MFLNVRNYCLHRLCDYLVGPGPPSTILLYGLVLHQSLETMICSSPLACFFAQLTKAHVVADSLPVLTQREFKFIDVHIVSYVQAFFLLCVCVPTALLEEHACTFQEALDKLYED